MVMWLIPLRELGTGANRVGYYYADYTAGNTMPDSAKATVNFVEE